MGAMQAGSAYLVLTPLESPWSESGSVSTVITLSPTAD